MSGIQALVMLAALGVFITCWAAARLLGDLAFLRTQHERDVAILEDKCLLHRNKIALLQERVDLLRKDVQVHLDLINGLEKRMEDAK